MRLPKSDRLLGVEMSSTTRAITGCILAGGRGRRLQGADKGFVTLAGRPLLVHVLNRFRPQVDEVVISANRHMEDYRRHCARVLADATDDHAGPLAGFAAAMATATTPHLAITPCDTPFIPSDMVDRLWRAGRKRRRDQCGAHRNAAATRVRTTGYRSQGFPIAISCERGAQGRRLVRRSPRS